MNDRDLAIVGMGCIFPRAHDLREYWRNIVNQVDCIEPLPPHRLAHAINWYLPKSHEAYMVPHRGGFVPNDLVIDPKAFGLLPNAVRNGDADQFLMLLVVDEALRDAGLARDDARRERTDVLLGRGGYPAGKQVELSLRSETYDQVLQLIDRKFPELLAGDRYSEVDAWLRSVLPPNEVDSLSTAVPNIVASRVANRFDLGGLAETVDGACASSLIALEHAVERLRAGRADIAVVGGVFLNQNAYFLQVFNRLRAVSEGGTIRPMDRRADGLLMGEGGGAIVLKRLDDALAQGDRIYAIVKGCGSSSDGRDVDVLAPSWKGQVRALERAYDDAAVDPHQIGYLELHGTGTLAGDLAEITSVREVFGLSKHPPTTRAMGSVKSQIGHLMPASGMAALIRTALALSHKILPPSLHCEQPREETLDCNFYVNTHTRPWVQNETRGPRFAAINSFGFGGVNSHAILQEAVPVAPKKRSRTKPLLPRPIEPGVDRPSELALWSAASNDDLIRQIEQLQAFLDQDQQSPTAADVACSLAARLNFAQPVKLAVVYETLPELRSRLPSLMAQLRRPEPRFTDEVIYYSPSAARHDGKVAFIFPGMGFPGLIGNYPDHLLELCVHYPELRAEFDFFEERDRHPDDDIPTSSVFVPPASLPEAYREKLKGRLAPPKVDVDLTEEPRPEERYLAAMGVTLANWISWTLLEQFEIPVDMATGQSQGEMAAVCAVGLGDFRETAPAYWRVLNVTPTAGNAGRLAFVWASEEQVAPLVEQNPGTYIAIYMAPMALILGGEREGLLRIIDELKKQQCLTQLLPYPAIHTPMLQHLHGELEEALKDEKFAVKKPRMALYSSITSELYPTDLVGVRHTLMLNLDHPLRVWQTIRRMYDDGARVFVQVGGGHMSAHMKQFMPVGEETVTAALDVDTRNPITQLNHLLATLFKAGVPFKTDALFSHRQAQAIDLSAPRGPAPQPRMLIPLRIEWSPLDHPLVPVRDRRPADMQVTPPAAEPVPAVQLSTETQPVAETTQVHEAARSASAAELKTSPKVRVTPPDNFVQQPPVVRFETPFPILINGHVTEYVAGVSLKIERVLDSVADRYILDHLFVHCPVRDPRDNLPIVPMTMSLEFIAEAAALLCPGLGLLGYENVKAMRWVALEDCDRTLLHFDARMVEVDDVTGEHRVDVTLSYQDKRAFSGRVVFGTQYRPTLEMTWPELPSETSWPFQLSEVYGERRMFHGPAFHVISRLDRFTNPMATAALRVLPKDQLFAGLPEPALLVDPCLLDGVGQLVGLWCQAFGWFILPTGVEKLEIYGPTPPVGTDCTIKLHVSQFDVELKQLKANFELEDGQGRVWMRMTGWGDWIFKWTPEFFAYNRAPVLYLIVAPLELPGLPEDALAFQFDERHLIGTDLLWGARTALTDDELQEFRKVEGAKAQRRFLSSKLAAKDAARAWLQRRQGGPLLHPAEIAVMHDDRGRPFLEAGEGIPVPEVTIAHKDQKLIVVVSESPLGVDLEPVGQPAGEILNDFASSEEQKLLEQLSEIFPERPWPTELWCAKEAAGKARGTGLNGYPKRLQLVDGNGDGCLVIRDIETEQHYDVRLATLEQYVVALASCQGDAEGVSVTGSGRSDHASST